MNKKLDETIAAVCDRVEKRIERNAADKDVAELVNALANLIYARATMSKLQPTDCLIQ